MDKSFLKKTLQAPTKPDCISANAQWLAGEGAGSWFVIKSTSKPLYFNVFRYSPSGELECKGVFVQEKSVNEFDIESDYTFEHLSHCAKVTIRQDNYKLMFLRLMDL